MAAEHTLSHWLLPGAPPGSPGALLEEGGLYPEPHPVQTQPHAFRHKTLLILPGQCPVPYICLSANSDITQPRGSGEQEAPFAHRRGSWAYTCWGALLAQG